MKANKTSWAKGQSGNKAGRPPKGYSITEAVREAMNSAPELKKKLVESIINRAIRGDMTACRLIWEYMDGKPTADITGGQRLEVRVTNLDEV